MKIWYYSKVYVGMVVAWVFDAFISSGLVSYEAEHSPFPPENLVDFYFGFAGVEMAFKGIGIYVPMLCGMVIWESVSFKVRPYFFQIAAGFIGAMVFLAPSMFMEIGKSSFVYMNAAASFCCISIFSNLKWLRRYPIAYSMHKHKQPLEPGSVPANNIGEGISQEAEESGKEGEKHE